MAKVNKLETPLLRVSRPVSACQRCRNAKVKCDGKLPACTACERAGRSEECSSANDQFARGKERSYVASLENRVDKLERQIAQAKARQETTNALDIVSAQPLLAPPVLAAGHSANGDSRNRRKEIQDVNDLVSDFGFLSVSPLLLPAILTNIPDRSMRPPETFMALPNRCLLLGLYFQRLPKRRCLGSRSMYFHRDMLQLR